MNQRAFITGATGFVGAALAEQLAEAGWELVTLVRAGSDTARLSELGATLVNGDLKDGSTYATALAGCQVVFHCAALTGVGHSVKSFYEVNLEGTRHLLDAAITAGVEKFVFVSSIVVYELDRSIRVYDETQPLLSSSIDPYGCAKAAAENLCMAAHNRGAISARIVRPAFIYGPGDRPGGFLPEMAAMIKHGKFRLIDGGHNPIALIYISDLVEILCRCAESDQAHGQTYNVSSADKITWRHLTDYLCETFEFTVPPEVSSRTLYPIVSLFELAVRCRLGRYLPISKTTIKLLSLDVQFPADKVIKQLGYRPKTDFRTGINNCLPMLRALLQ